MVTDDNFTVHTLEILIAVTVTLCARGCVPHTVRTLLLYCLVAVTGSVVPEDDVEGRVV